jgi:hypothetical protein
MCASAFAQPKAGEALERIEFALGDARYHMAMPKGSRLLKVHQPGCVDIRHPHSVRLMKLIELCAAAGSPAGPYRRQVTLGNGARVRYEMNHDVGGGMAGTEGELKGQLEFEGRVLALMCRDQSEEKTEPDWCLRYLHSLAIGDRK